MFGSIREALANVHNELSNAVQKLKSNQQQFPEGCFPELFSNLYKSQAGSNLLLKYQLNIEQIEQMNDENIRAANLCSTRMGRVHQMCNEQAESILQMHNTLKTVPKISKQLSSLSAQLEKLNRFLTQTELAMTHLEAIIAIANNEELIEKRKKVLRKQKEELLEKDEKERHWISKQPNLSISEEVKFRDSKDIRECEEMMLEEFLNQ